MCNQPRKTKLFWLVLLLCQSAVWAQERVTLQASFADNAQPLKLSMLVGQTRVVDFDQPYERVAVSDDKIAEVVLVSDKQVLLKGLAFGRVSVAAWAKRSPDAAAGETARLLLFDVTVQVNLALLGEQLRQQFPNEHIQLSQASNGVVLSGNVSKPEWAEQVRRLVEATGLKVNNLLNVPETSAVPVQLQLRLIEVDRRLAREVGAAQGLANHSMPVWVNTHASGEPSEVEAPRERGGQRLANSVHVWLGDGAGYLRALQTRGAARELGEPAWLVWRGQPASFRAGGEYPVPVINPAADGAVTGTNVVAVSFKEFGLKLKFQPTVLDETHLRLTIEPEISSLDFSSRMTVQGLLIPGLRVRRAGAALELRDGQSFMLAGLLDSTDQANLAKVPVLGETPVLGELFKSRSFQRRETELLLQITVKLGETLTAEQPPAVADSKPAALQTPAPGLAGQTGHALPAKPATERQEKPESKPAKAPKKP